MWKVMIADDEPFVREGLKILIDWKDMGYELVSICSDGKELLDAIEKEQPDLVILDIRMPVINGLEAARIIYEKWPEIYMILLTAHAEFQYAKEAIEYQVKKYIVKTNVIDDLVAVLPSVSEVLLEEKGERESKEKDIIAKIMDFIEAQYMRKLSLEEIANEVHINKFYLSRLFKERTGENLIDYINKKRIDRAKVYFKEGGKKIYEIADLIGLYDTAYFSKIFKKYTGYAPSEYIKKMESEEK